MWESISTTVSEHWTYYCTELAWQWHHMTPAKYGVLLICIFAFGWVLLKSNMRK